MKRNANKQQKSTKVKQINFKNELLKLSQGVITLAESQGKDKKLKVLDNIKRNESFNIANKRPQILWENLYQILHSDEFLVSAYANIRNNSGSLTPGVDGETLDKFGIVDIKRIQSELKTQSFKVDPVKEILIPKPGKKEKRPLGIPTIDDRIVGEGIRMILEAIFEPHFETQNSNHGFRPNKSVHTCLQNVDYELRGFQYIIEGDIKGAFPSLDHSIIINILKKYIKCNNFLKLIQMFLKSGKMTEQDHTSIYAETVSGVPQGQLFSPILWNIYMHDFDIFVTKKLQEFVDENYNINRTIRITPKKYRQLTFQIHSATKNATELKRELNKPISEYTETERNHLKSLERKEIRERNKRLLVPSIAKSSQKIRLLYRRYADDWILATTASLEITQILKNKIADWLKSERNLILSPEKTKITDTEKEAIKFLGFAIKQQKILIQRRVNSNDTKEKYPVRIQCPFSIQPDFDRHLSRLALHGYLKERSQQELLNNPKLSKFKPIEKSGYSTLHVSEIFNKYNSIALGYYNFLYTPTSQKSKLQIFEYILKYSLIKTLALKFRSTSGKLTKKSKENNNLFRRNKSASFSYTETVQGKDVTYEFTTLAKFVQNNIENKESKPLKLIEDIHNQYKVNWRTRKSLLYGRCVQCGDPAVVSHHINSIKEKTTRHYRKNNGKMIRQDTFRVVHEGLRRKQLPLCVEHHKQATNGTLPAELYGVSLEKLYYYRISKMEKGENND